VQDTTVQSAIRRDLDGYFRTRLSITESRDPRRRQRLQARLRERVRSIVSYGYREDLQAFEVLAHE
jgi:hypothetical protein